MRQRCRLYAILLILWFVASPRARALLTFNEGKDQVFVHASYSFGYDSNIFTQKVAQGSSTQNMSFGINYSRRAGIIAVNASVDWGLGQFSQFKSQDFTDPSYSLSFTKGTGRTTGSLSLSAQKSAVPDPDANARAVSWDYSASLDLRYPVNERYFFTNGTTYSNTLYTDKAIFTDLGNITDGLNLNYVYNSKLDFSGGYKFGLSETDDTTDYDQSFIIGANGSILPKLTGSIGVGLEDRNSEYAGTDEHYASTTANGALNWRYSHLLSFSGSVDKGFGTSSTDISTDTTTVGLNTDISLLRRLRTSVGVDYTATAFLGVLGAGRRDTLWQFTANLGTALTTHVNTNLTYAYMINYSNVGSAEFVRQTLGLNVRADY